jgi:hypothetical protein
MNRPGSRRLPHGSLLRGEPNLQTLPRPAQLGAGGPAELGREALPSSVGCCTPRSVLVIFQESTHHSRALPGQCASIILADLCE